MKTLESHLKNHQTFPKNFGKDYLLIYNLRITSRREAPDR